MFVDQYTAMYRCVGASHNTVNECSYSAYRAGFSTDGDIDRRAQRPHWRQVFGLERRRRQGLLFDGSAVLRQSGMLRTLCNAAAISDHEPPCSNVPTKVVAACNSSMTLFERRLCVRKESAFDRHH
jgi:hypothetical protein